MEAFQLRKLEWAIEELIKEEKSITKWSLLEKSGVKDRYMACIYAQIEEMLDNGGLSTDLLLPSIKFSE